MSASHPSLLRSPRDPLLPYVGAAIVGHAVAATVLVLLMAWTGHDAAEPLVEPEVLTVELVALTPKGAVNRAQRAPRAPTAAGSATSEPPPVRSSDLTVRTDTPDPGTQEQPRKDERLDALMDELARDRLLDDLDAAEGPVDRDAASPDGVEGATTSIAGAGVGDPEYAAYIAKVSQLFVAGFQPLPALRGQGLVTVVRVDVDVDGRITGASVSTPSANPSWDRAALAAAELVDTIPLPPARYRDGKPDRYLIRFEDPR